MNNERTNGVLKQTAGPPECLGTWGLVPTIFGRYMNPIPIIGGNDAHSIIHLFPTPHQYLRHSGAPNYSNEYSTIHGCKLYYHAMSLFLPQLFAFDKLNLELILESADSLQLELYFTFALLTSRHKLGLFMQKSPIIFIND